MQKIKLFVILPLLSFATSFTHALPDPNPHHTEDSLILHFFPKKIDAREKKKITKIARDYCHKQGHKTIDTCLREEIKKLYLANKNKNISTKNNCLNTPDYFFDASIGTCKRPSDQ